MTRKHTRFIFYAIITVSAVLYSILNFQYRTGIINDDAVYVMGARRLWHSLPFISLVLKPDYPLPGLPLLLAPLIKVVEPCWIHLEWLAVAATVVCVFLLGIGVRKLPSSGEAMAVVVLFAFNPLVAQFSGILMPALFYTAIVIASYLLMGGLMEKPTIQKALGLGFLLGWGSLIRPEGILLLISVIAVLLRNRQGRQILHVTILPIGFWLLFFLYWWRSQGAAHTEYGGDLTVLTSYWSHHLASGLRFAGGLLYDFFVHSLTSLPSEALRSSTFFGGVLIAVCLAMITMGFRSIWKDETYPRPLLLSIAIFCGIYVVTHIFWHVLQPRYAIPVLPFALVFLVRGANELLLPLKWRKLWIKTAFVVLLLSYSYKNGYAVYETLWARDPMKSPPWRSLAWIRGHTPSRVKIISNVAPNIELYTNRPALSGIHSNNYELLMFDILNQHLEYVVDRRLIFLTTDVEGAENLNADWNRLRLWISGHPEQFSLVFRDPVEQTDIYRIDTEPGFAAAYPKFTQAAQKYAEGKLEEAFRLAHDSFALDPGLGSASLLLGVLYWRTNDLRNAERYFLKTIELLPLTWKARLNLATLYHQEGRDDLSEKYIQQALEIAGQRGQQEQMNRRLQMLQHMWNQHSGFIFIDVPAQPEPDAPE